MSTQRETTFEPLTALRRSWWVILLCLLLGAVAVGTAATLRPVTYTSSAIVQWQSGGGQQLLGIEVDNPTGDDAQRALTTQSDVLLGDGVMTAAVAALSGIDIEDLREETTVTPQDGSNVLLVEVNGESAEQARQRAEAVVASYVTISQQRGVADLSGQADALQPSIDALNGQLNALNAANPPPRPGSLEVENPTVAAQRQALIGQLAELTQQQSQYRTAAAVYRGEATVLAAADEPEEPSSLSPQLGASLGAALGLVLGIMLALLRGSGTPRASTPRRERGRARRARGGGTEPIVAGPVDGDRPEPAPDESDQAPAARDADATDDDATDNDPTEEESTHEFAAVPAVPSGPRTGSTAAGRSTGAHERPETDEPSATDGTSGTDELTRTDEPYQPVGAHGRSEPYEPAQPYEPAGTHERSEPYESSQTYGPVERYDTSETYGPSEDYESADEYESSTADETSADRESSPATARRVRRRRTGASTSA